MLEILGNYTGDIIINGKTFSSKKDAEDFLNTYKGGITITLGAQKGARSLIKPTQSPEGKKTNFNDTLYEIEVQRYMTTYGKDFFLDKLNLEGPMPFIIMFGRKVEETQKMVLMECFASMRDARKTRCMKCGRTTFDIPSQIIGIGAECGYNEYRESIINGEDVDLVREGLNAALKNVTWRGWIIKDAFIKITPVV